MSAWIPQNRLVLRVYEGIFPSRCECTRPREDRAVAELAVGKASLANARVDVSGGFTAIRHLTDHQVELWCGAPVIDIQLELGPYSRKHLDPRAP